MTDLIKRLSEVYTAQNYDKRIADYPLGEAAKDVILGLSEVSTAADIGCGTGYLGRNTPHINWTGIDPLPEMCEVALASGHYTEVLQLFAHSLPAGRQFELVATIGCLYILSPDELKIALDWMSASATTYILFSLDQVTDVHIRFNRERINLYRHEVSEALAHFQNTGWTPELTFNDIGWVSQSSGEHICTPLYLLTRQSP